MKLYLAAPATNSNEVFLSKGNCHCCYSLSGNKTKKAGNIKQLCQSGFNWESSSACNYVNHI